MSTTTQTLAPMRKIAAGEYEDHTGQYLTRSTHSRYYRTTWWTVYRIAGNGDLIGLAMSVNTYRSARIVIAELLDGTRTCHETGREPRY